MKNDFATVQVTLGADVANAGTFTINYPSGYNAGDFSNAAGHYLMLNGDKLLQPQHITLSFGATAVTVTNGTGATLPAGSKGYFQFEVLGASADIVGRSSANRIQTVHAALLQGVYVDFGAPVATDADGICASQSVTSGEEAVFDGALVANGVVSLDVPRNIVAAWTGTAIVTVTGLDEYGEEISEKSASGTSLTGVKAFKTVTSITFNANVTAATVGTGKVLGLPLRLTSKNQIVAFQEAGVITKADLVRIGFQHTEAELDAATDRYLAPGFAGEIIDAGIVLENTVTTGGAMTYTVGATTVVGLTNTIADGATAGTFYQDTPTGDGTEYFLATDFIKVAAASAINASAPTTEWITTRKSNGKTVTGLAKNTKSTATTADVRGTFTPNTNPDGTTSFGLFILTNEPSDLGNIQYTV